MDKRYQVFVSSTYRDLREERQNVIQALLELDCFPCSMEFFPAANEDVWEAIQQLIRECDYYLVIVGGKYGSEDEDGISYTQKEYQYAVEQGKPAIAFLPRNPENIPSGRTEPTQKAQKKLEAFKELCGKKLCKEWDSPADLRAAVTTSMVKLMKHNPAVGWVRADKVTDYEKTVRLYDEIEQLKQENENLKAEQKKDESWLDPKDYPKLCLRCATGANATARPPSFTTTVELIWERVFEELGSRLLFGCDDWDLERVVDRVAQKELSLAENYPLVVHPEDIRGISQRLIGFGLAEKNGRGRETVWSLTQRGKTATVKVTLDKQMKS